MARLVTAVALLALLLFMIGCAKGTTAEGTLYTANIMGELQAYLPVKLDKVYAAAGKAVEDMGYSAEESAIDVREAKVEGRTALDKPVRVKLYKQGESVTKVEVYVGGDKLASKDLLDKIEARSD
jgi:hypothetical protein